LGLAGVMERDRREGENEEVLQHRAHCASPWLLDERHPGAKHSLGPTEDSIAVTLETRSEEA
jgi:hypothetical protein